MYKGTPAKALNSYLSLIHKWVPATQQRNHRKGKIKTPLLFHGKRCDAYLSHVKVQITASKKDIYLVLVYGITEHPMLLATNKKDLKGDVVNVAKAYFSRWCIEEYAKKLALILV